MSLDEFMNQGGNNIEEIFSSIMELNFPENLHQIYVNRLDEDWKKKVYFDLVESLQTKQFDIYKSELHNHISKKEFKYLKAMIFECLHIEVQNERKRGLFID